MSGTIRVLVVDDSALMRKLLPQMLQRDKTIEVVGTAMDGAFGMKKIEEVQPHVITLDLEMPRMDGTEMLRQIMRTQKIPVIIVSAYGTLMNEQDAHQAAGVIQKPFDYDDLVGQVERATARTLEVALT